jgi:hypothetical protein
MFAEADEPASAYKRITLKMQATGSSATSILLYDTTLASHPKTH